MQQTFFFSAEIRPSNRDARSEQRSAAAGRGCEVQAGGAESRHLSAGAAGAAGTWRAAGAGRRERRLSAGAAGAGGRERRERLSAGAAEVLAGEETNAERNQLGAIGGLPTAIEEERRLAGGDGAATPSEGRTRRRQEWIEARVARAKKKPKALIPC